VAEDYGGEKLSTEKVESFLRRARHAFSTSDFIAGSAKHTSSDFSELELIGHEDQLNAISRVLNELSVEHYCGPEPPNHKSGEPKCKGARMMQFVWKSTCFSGKEMCVKFCMVGERLAVLRIHAAYNPNRYGG
jgi:hypothetical protein